MKIANFVIGEKKVFIIAEIGNNHNGSFDLAIEMIDEAIASGADCVKFQMRNLNAIYRKKSLSKDATDLGTEYILDLLDKFELSKNEHFKISEYCAKKNILYMCTPWDTDSVKTLESFNVPAYKVASADLTNLPLLDALIETNKPIILSTGMSTISEIQFTSKYLKNQKSNFALLHCNSTYPAPLHDINLNWMKRLHKIHSLIGYSGHERGTAVSIAAVTLGAKIIERHFTFDRNMEGPDHAASLIPEEFSALVSGIREVEQALGEGNERYLSQGEMINRENLAKSIVAASKLAKGTVINSNHLKIRSPGQGLSAQNMNQLIGMKLKRDMSEEDYFYPSDLDGNVSEAKCYNFNRPWGVPVRYHDFDEYNQKVSPDIFEFHLSYSDLDLNISDYLDGIYECGFVVHAPELFSNSRLMDLASPDSDYRAFSIRETQRVIEVTKRLNKYFPSTGCPMIVANIGGFTMDKLLPKSDINEYYERFAKSLQELNCDGVEIIPQTMAPFPWHFGGQRYQNLFVHFDETMNWCNKLNLRMCFDISHSKLMCNHFQIDFYEFAEKIAPITSHIHFGDALGVNGEGLQIGEGDIDFQRLAKILDIGCPNASFIPEIWQGHKDSGNGFWVALEKLELYL
jgi:sialic acid synthase SpsE/sugar phosphate isomerase/epimerase